MNFSERELYVLKRAAQGALRKQIAAELALHEVTVSHSLRTVADKLRTRDRAQWQAFVEKYKL